VEFVEKYRHKETIIDLEVYLNVRINH